MGDIEKRMEKCFGVNQKLIGDYDKTCAVRCENGTFVGERFDGVLSFKGIPFALPPVGELRYKAPVPCKEDTGVYQAKYYGASPLQSVCDSEVASKYRRSEDCLYLNIWKYDNDAAKRPVVVFFHGGSYGWGGTSDPLYDGRNFVREHKDILFVTCEYRLGMMGFLDLSYLSGSEGYEDSCNLGILDNIAALTWIHDNIEHFGGDPSNVTIAGESAGGGIASILPVLPMARGLFQKSICESGSIILTQTKKESEKMTRKVMKKLGISSLSELLKASEEEILQVMEDIGDYNNFPIRDGRIIPEDLFEAYETDFDGSVDFLVGTNADEARYWISELGGRYIYRHAMQILLENWLKALPVYKKKIVRAFLKCFPGRKVWAITELANEILFRLPAIYQSELAIKKGARVFMYYWAEESSIPYRGACHAVELSYVWGNTKEEIYTGAPIDEAFAKDARAMWAQFIRKTNPSTEEHRWPMYDEKRRMTMVFGHGSERCMREIDFRSHSKNHKITISLDPLKEQREKLMGLLEHRFSGSMTAVTYNVPHTRKLAAMAIGLVAGGVAVFAAIYHFHKKK